MSSDLTEEILSLIRGEQTFHEKTIAEVCEMATTDAEFRVSLHRAIDALRDEGIEFAPVPGSPGMRHRVEGTTALNRARRFHQGAIRKLERASIQVDNVDPSKLSSADQRALARTRDHIGTLAANAHITARQAQETSTLLSKMSEPKKRSA